MPLNVSARPLYQPIPLCDKSNSPAHIYGEERVGSDGVKANGDECAAPVDPGGIDEGHYKRGDT